MSAQSPAKSILVTGGAGFVGSHLVDRLRCEGHRITIIDDLSTGRAKNIKSDDKHVQFLRGHVVDVIPELVNESFDEVYHLAACVGVDLVLQRPAEVIESSLRATSVVLDAVAKWKCPALVTSSSEVYGKSARTPFREDDDVMYGPTSITRWSYAYAKAMDEFLALSYVSRMNMDVTIVRLFNTVGPRQVGDYGMVLPRFVGAALRNESLEVFGDGTQVRCFCDVRDVVGALIALVRQRDKTHRVFNVGSDEPVSIGALAQRVIDELGSTSAVRYVDYAKAYGAGFEDIPARIPDLTRLRTAIAFSPSVSLSETIEDLATELQNEQPTVATCHDGEPGRPQA